MVILLTSIKRTHISHTLSYSLIIFIKNHKLLISTKLYQLMFQIFNIWIFVIQLTYWVWRAEWTRATTVLHDDTLFIFTTWKAITWVVTFTSGTSICPNFETIFTHLCTNVVVTIWLSTSTSSFYCKSNIT